MNKKLELTKFLLFLFVFVLAVAGHNFGRYYIVGDYPVHVFTACDPTVNSCFEADPELADPTFQTGPYAKVEVDAAYAPSCLDEHTCTNFSCDGVASSCKVTYCDNESLEEGEFCTNENE